MTTTVFHMYLEIWVCTTHLPSLIPIRDKLVYNGMILHLPSAHKVLMVRPGGEHL